MLAELTELERDWDEAARENARWNILTIPGQSEAEFWESGRIEIRELLETVDPPRNRALDFGCGIGRLSTALARHFRKVDAVDVSAEMIARAKPHKRVTYRHRVEPNLWHWGDRTFDLVYSNIVLQHMHPHLAEGYVREFLRVSRGYVVFQLPEGQHAGSGALRIYGTPRELVEGWLRGHEIVRVDENEASGAGRRSWRYTVKA